MKDFLKANGGDPCIDSVVRGRYCPDLTTPTTFYHAASVTKEFGDKLEFTLGVTNIFDTPPPRVSVLNGSTISMIGPVVSASQYDFIGRRVFFNVSKRF
jgi:iron complex outermembrane receptor protein